MNSQHLINQALSSGHKVISQGYYTVEGNPELNQLHIGFLDKVCQQNMVDFAEGTSRGWCILGVFPSHEAASEFCELYRSYIRSPEGELLLK